MADGSDGAFAPINSVVVDLSKSTTPGIWDQANTANEGLGVYDPVQWAVVFKYASVKIPEGVTVTFVNHPSRAPVIWLVSGDAVIDGVIDLSGESGLKPRNTEPGPGGFRGGIGGSDSDEPAAAGFGPGGGGFSNNQGAGSYATPGTGILVGATYGNSSILPLVGGSGGSGRAVVDRPQHSGGAGGGAILIAATGRVTVNGMIRANGGMGICGGGGSGGAIRIVCAELTGAGRLEAKGGTGGCEATELDGNANGGAGRIRLEAVSAPAAILSVPQSIAIPAEDPPVIIPGPATPTLAIASVGGVPSPGDPQGRLAPPAPDIRLSPGGGSQVLINAQNLATNAQVFLRIVPKFGQDFTVQAAFRQGNAATSTWEAKPQLPAGFCALQVRAVSP